MMRYDYNIKNRARTVGAHASVPQDAHSASHSHDTVARPCCVISAKRMIVERREPENESFIRFFIAAQALGVSFTPDKPVGTLKNNGFWRYIGLLISAMAGLFTR